MEALVHTIAARAPTVGLAGMVAMVTLTLALIVGIVVATHTFREADATGAKVGAFFLMLFLVVGWLALVWVVVVGVKLVTRVALVAKQSPGLAALAQTAQHPEAALATAATQAAQTASAAAPPAATLTARHERSPQYWW